MKTIILIRHAKSGWSDMTLDDYDRPLNKRGKRNLPIMAKHLKTQNIEIDQIYSSVALRAKTTAKEFAKQLEVPLKLYENLYMQSVSELLSFINEKLTKHDSIALVGHNPGLTDLCNEISATNIENIPTCGYVVLQAYTDTITHNSCQVLDFAYPKREDITNTVN